MKNKLILFEILLLSITFQVCSQENEISENFAYRSFSISPIGIYVGTNTGVAISGDVSFDYGKNIFSLAVGAGSEGSFIAHNDEFTEINFLYGRSFLLSEKIFTDVFVGAGYFHFKTYGYINDRGWKGTIKDNTIGFPIGAKVQFMLGPRYSMGLKLGANINSLETIGTIGIVLQWNQKRN